MANIWALLNNLDGHCLAPPQLRHEFGTKTRQSAGAGRTTRSQADGTVNATLPSPAASNLSGASFGVANMGGVLRLRMLHHRIRDVTLGPPRFCGVHHE